MHLLLPRNLIMYQMEELVKTLLSFTKYLKG